MRMRAWRMAAAWSLLLLCPATARASEQVIFGGSSDAIGTTLKIQSVMGAPANTWGTGAAAHNQTISAPGSLHHLRVKLDSSLASGSVAFTLLINGNVSSNSPTCTVTATTCADETHWLPVSPGDTILLQADLNGGASAPAARWSLVFSGTNPAQSNLMGGEPGNIGGITQLFAALHGAQGDVTTEFYVKTLIPTAGSVKKLYVELQNAPGSGNSRTFTVRKNSVDMALACTISDTASTCSHLGDAFSVAAGDSISMGLTGTGAPAASKVWWGVTFEATTDGESIIAQSGSTLLQSASTVYGFVSAGDSSWNTTQSAVVSLGQSTTIKNMYVELVNAPTGSASYAFTLQKNGSDTALECAVVGAATTCNATANVLVADGDTLNIKCIPTGSPTQRRAHVSLTSVITPRPRRILLNEE